MASLAPGSHAQITKVIFQDDFSSNTVDPGRYTPDAPFFEGGIGNIRATAHDGVIEFVGTTTQQWWSGATLSLNNTYNATESSPVSISIDRVAEAGVGTASRSALWILDETKTKYVLFADVRAEGGWRYNRKIGENGDVPTGSGTDIAAFNGASFDDGGRHRMSIVANGKTVKLLLDGVQGAEVSFPFNKVIFQFGSYARANNDTASTTWDNLRVEQVLPTTIVLEDDFSSNTINPARYTPSAPFFEGGVGDIRATAHDGVIEFVGTTTQQWWSGATLQISPSLTATEATPVSITIDRVREAGVGTASRSALWILDETKTKYVLFADVRAEGGWRYNRKIGENGDVPTGSGTDIAAFNGASFDDGGLHQMRIIADGRTAKLYLDGILGAEVAFPFTKVIFEFGSYARANNDTASTTWDNLKIETVVRQSSVVFADDFASNTIDPAKYQASAPFFEGGVGDIRATAHDGVIEFVGTTTQQWWSGGTLRIVPTFAPSEAEVITLSIDRVAEAGVGTASRSALWILDETRTRYVLFADVRGEGGWRYNRKIGEDGDVPTGGGINIAAFDGAAFDNGGLHRMSMIADGKTVKLLLDGIQGAEVKFPFSPVVFEFGSYARANNDTAGTTWDNLRIESAGGATFLPTTVSVRKDQTSGNITVRIPQGLNSQASVNVTVSTSDASIALPDGATGGKLTLTFPAGGSNTQTFRAKGVAEGGATFSLDSDVIGGGNVLSVVVVGNPGVVLEDTFTGASLDTTKWQVSNVPFENASGAYTVSVTSGVLDITGTTLEDFWGGASIKSARSFTATRDLNLSVEVDRVAVSPSAIAARTGVFLTTTDRSKFVFFGQNIFETGWAVNVNPGNPTGGGTSLAVFDALDDSVTSHKIRMVANGSTVEVFLDGVSGGTFPFEVTTGIHVEVAAYARTTGDVVAGNFDNVRVTTLLPCTTFADQSVSMTLADAARPTAVNVPALLHDAAPMTVTITSQNPAVAIPAGAVNGALTINVAAGADSRQAFRVQPVGKGSTAFTVTTSPASCTGAALRVEVVAVPEVLLTDDFSGATINTVNWEVDANAFDTAAPGVPTGESAITLANGQVKISVTAESGNWPGMALFTARTYTAGATTPTTFEVERVDHDFVLVTGTGAYQRTGAWIKHAASQNYVFFSDNVAHNGRNFGWRYNQSTGQPNDNPLDDGVNIPAFDGARFDDQGKHAMRLVANGSTVKLYLDGVFGAEVPFPHTSGFTFGFGAYVQAATDVVTGYFDNVRILGGEGAAPVPARLAAAVQGANIVISWTGTGALEESDTVAPGNWRAVTPAPAGNTHTIANSSNAGAKFFRIRQ